MKPRESSNRNGCDLGIKKYRDEKGRAPVISGELATRIATQKDASDWNGFVASQPGFSQCHLFEWSTVFELAYGKTCYRLVTSRGDKWEGVLPLVHMKGPLTGNRLVSVAFLDEGGILAESKPAAQALRQAAFELARQVGARGVDFRGESAGGEATTGSTSRFRFLLALGESEEELWKAIGPKVRNQIRKAEKSGLLTERVDVLQLDRFYSLFARNMRDLGSPVHSRRFFREIFEVLGEAAQLYLTVDGEETPVAGAVCLQFRDTAVVPWASSLKSARSQCPNHSLYWEILRTVQREGVREFDFGRSSEGAGTYHFKKQWRARLVPLVWKSFDAQGQVVEVANLNAKEHAKLAKLWSRLPVRVANVLGPLVRRQLSN